MKSKMMCVRSLFAALSAFALTSFAQGAVIRVSPDGADGADGSSWSSPKSLVSALKSASKGSELWLKAGGYPIAKTATEGFVIPVALTLRGGFAGTEAQADARSGGAFSCLFVDDPAQETANVPAVLTFAAADGQTLVENLVVSNGTRRGVLMEGAAGDVVVSHCRIVGNGVIRKTGVAAAADGRGARFVGTGANTVTIRDTVFGGNGEGRAAGLTGSDELSMRGLALYAENLKGVVLEDSSFRNNGEWMLEEMDNASKRKVLGKFCPPSNARLHSVVEFASAPATVARTSFRGNRIGSRVLVGMSSVDPRSAAIVRVSGAADGTSFADCEWTANDIIQPISACYAGTGAIQELSPYAESGAVVVDCNRADVGVAFTGCTFAYNVTPTAWTAGLRVEKGAANVRKTVFWGNVINARWGIASDLSAGLYGTADVDASLFAQRGGRFCDLAGKRVTLGENMVYGDPGFGTRPADFLRDMLTVDTETIRLDEECFPIAATADYRADFNDANGGGNTIFWLKDGTYSRKLGRDVNDVLDPDTIDVTVSADSVFGSKSAKTKLSVGVRAEFPTDTIPRFTVTAGAGDPAKVTLAYSCGSVSRRLVLGRIEAGVTVTLDADVAFPSGARLTYSVTAENAAGSSSASGSATVTGVDAGAWGQKTLAIAPVEVPSYTQYGTGAYGWLGNYIFLDPRGAQRTGERAAVWYRHFDVPEWGRVEDPYRKSRNEPGLDPDYFALMKPTDAGDDASGPENRPLIVFLHGRGGGFQGVCQHVPNMTDPDSIYHTPDGFYGLMLDARNAWANDFWWGAMPPAKDSVKGYGDNCYWSFDLGESLHGWLNMGPTDGDFLYQPNTYYDVWEKANPYSCLEWCCRDLNHDGSSDARDAAGRPDDTPTMKRVLDTIEWVVRKYKIDRNRIYLAGNSMGGQGTLAIGLKHGEVFAAINGNVPATIWYPAAQLGFVDTKGANVPAENYQAPAADAPICVDWSGSNDAWSRRHDVMYDNMERFRMQYIGWWGNFGHCGSLAQASATNDLVNTFDWRSVRKNEPYPVFTHASCNSALPWPESKWLAAEGSGGTIAGGVEAAAGELIIREGGTSVGQWNAFFRWKVVTDTQGGFAIDLWLADEKELPSRTFAAERPTRATTDVSLRRLQRFPRTGSARWTFGDKSGTVSFDAKLNTWTVEGLELTTTPKRLTLAAGAQGPCVGAVVSDVGSHSIGIDLEPFATGDAGAGVTVKAKYGTSVAALREVTLKAGLTAPETVRLTGLSAETTYLVRLVVSNASGATSEIDLGSVTTGPAGAASDPAIASVATVSSNPSEVVVTLDSLGGAADAATVEVALYADAARKTKVATLAKTVAQTGEVRFAFDGLEPRKAFFVEVTVTGDDGRTVRDSTQAFVSPASKDAPTAPTVVSLTPSSASGRVEAFQLDCADFGACGTFVTVDVEVFSDVRMLYSVAKKSFKVTKTGVSSFDFAGLMMKTKYYYRAAVTSSNGLAGDSFEGDFTTSTDAVYEWDRTFLARLASDPNVTEVRPAGITGGDLVLRLTDGIREEFVVVFTNTAAAAEFSTDTGIDAEILLVGAGGGSGAGVNSGWVSSSGAGGNGGEVKIVRTFLTGTTSVGIGVGGAGATKLGATAGAGGATTFGAFAAQGGAGGASAADGEPTGAAGRGGSGAGTGPYLVGFQNNGVASGGDGIESEILGFAQSFGGGGAGGAYQQPNGNDKWARAGGFGGGGTSMDGLSANGIDGLGGGAAATRIAAWSSKTISGARGGSGFVAIRFALADEGGVHRLSVPVGKDSVYDGQPHGSGIANSPYYTVTETPETEVGDYSSTVTLVDTSAFVWADKSTAPQSVAWRILPGTPKITGTLRLDSWVAGETPNTPSGLESDLGEIVYAYYSDEACTQPIALPTTETPGGVYFVRGEIAATKNWSAAVSSPAQFKIFKTTLDVGDALEINGSFEEGTVIGDNGGSFGYYGANTHTEKWTGGALSKAGSAFGVTGDFVVGTYCAIIQGGSSLTQEILLPQGGTFTLSFRYRRRNLNANVDHQIVVSLDGAETAKLTGNVSAQQNKTFSTSVSIPKGTHTLKFAGGKVDVDVATFIDDIKLVCTAVDGGDDPETPKQATVPTAKTGLVYTGAAQTGVAAGTGFTLEGNAATDAGNYTATAKLASGYEWADGSTSDKSIAWSIAQATPKITGTLTLAGWTEGDAPRTPSGLATDFGTLVYAYYADATCTQTMSAPSAATLAGTYYVRGEIAATKNWTAACSAAVQFTVAKKGEEPPDDPPEPPSGDIKPGDEIDINGSFDAAGSSISDNNGAFGNIGTGGATTPKWMGDGKLVIGGTSIGYGVPPSFVVGTYAMAFQNNSVISQKVDIAASGCYRISYRYMRRNFGQDNFADSHRVDVLVNGEVKATNSGNTDRSTVKTYSSTIRLEKGQVTLAIQTTAKFGQTTFVDDVKLVCLSLDSAAKKTVAVGESFDLNGGFENFSQIENSKNYGSCSQGFASTDKWTGSFVLAKLNSDYGNVTGDFAGSYCAIVQGGGKMEQRVYVPQAGTYALAFDYRRRQEGSAGTHHAVAVQADGAEVAALSGNTSTAKRNFSCELRLTAGWHTLGLKGTPSAGLDQSTFVDGLTLTCTALEETPVEEDRPKVDGEEVDPSKLADVVSGQAVTLPKGWKIEGQMIKNASGETVATYPAYYDIVSGEGGTYELRLNDTAMPVLDAEGEDEPFKVEAGEGTVKFVLKGVEEKLWYGVKSAEALTDEFEPTGKLEKGADLKTDKTISVERDSQDAVRFYRLYATDIAPAVKE